MMKTPFYARTGAAALAAALAFSPTFAVAQDAAPVADVPVAIDTAPAIPETTPPVVNSERVAIAPVADPAPVAKSTKVAKARAAPPVARSTAAVQAAPAPVIAAPAAPAPIAEPVPVLAQDVAPPPAELPAAAVTSPISNGAAEMAFAGALGLLVLSGAALGLSRRRRNRAVVEADEFIPITATVPRQPATAMGHDDSAFAWGRAAPAAAALAPNRRIESPIERAKRGPSPDNPSLSLKKRLKRAAFFEHRQREVAAGRAQPLPIIAGLPQRLIDKARHANLGQSNFGDAGFTPALQPA
ncbi:MAG: hypothetical protein H0W71_05805 [Sphingomonas sp.]|nr:hypothetical protein [Sphingomonas sp.]